MAFAWSRATLLASSCLLWFACSSNDAPSEQGSADASSGGAGSGGGALTTGGSTASSGGTAGSGGTTGGGGTLNALGGQGGESPASGGASASGGSGGGTSLASCGNMGGASATIPSDAFTVQFGSDDKDEVRNVAVDCRGDIYVVGETYGLIGDNLLQNLGDFDVYVSKLSGADGSLLWSQQFGTENEDRGYGIAIDNEGNVVVGGTYSGAVVGDAGGWKDTFLAKLAGDSGVELWRKQYKTSEVDFGYAVAVDADDNIVFSTSIATGNYDALVRKVSGVDGAELWAERFGTNVTDIPTMLTVDAGGDVYVVGYTLGALAASNLGSEDVFVRRLAGSTGAELWTVQFGSNKPDYGQGIALTADGEVVVGGYVSLNGSVDGNPSAGSNDGFARKLKASDGSELWTKQFGTSDSEEVWSVAVDSSGRIFISGRTYGSLGAPNAGSGDHYIQELDPSTGAKLPALQFGTNVLDMPQTAVLDPADHLIAVGMTAGAFPTFTNKGIWDAYVRKLTP